ncbi:MAG: HAD family hydrolase [Lachnospiraceae bacterium]
MKQKLRSYSREKNFLVCIDSDGCAMNTMELKHRTCFAPCLITEWGLEAYEKQVEKLWMDVNVYAVTRGVNRFQGLYIVLKYIDENIVQIPDVDSYGRFLETTEEFSNVAIIRYLEDNYDEMLEKVLRWSQMVSKNISLIPVEERKPFDGVEDAIDAMSDLCDIVVVSAANPDAVHEEWEMHGLMYRVKNIFSQNVGTQAFCIKRLMEEGYDKDHIILIGDGLENLHISQETGVLYFPILGNQETTSWEFFREVAFEKFIEGTYAGSYQEEQMKLLLDSLTEEYWL